MRAERGFSVGMRKVERLDFDLAPVKTSPAAIRADVVAERNIVLAMLAAMVAEQKAQTRVEEKLILSNRSWAF